jgi:hypothetical protein
MFTSGGHEWDKIYIPEDDGNESSADSLWLLAAFIFNWTNSVSSFPKSNHLFPS